MLTALGYYVQDTWAKLAHCTLRFCAFTIHLERCTTFETQNILCRQAEKSTCAERMDVSQGVTSKFNVGNCKPLLQFANDG